mmetsp:Transcript_68165/g.183475  ORF Transcript_68165/g.183475 Transcript_68165/m.183475 type:complete len:218 (+) Transcript_68165:353-1006(+)
MQRLPQRCAPQDIASYYRCIAELRVDNFGATGARMMLRGLGIDDAPREFSDRVASKHPQFGAGFGSIDRPSQFKIHAFAEYSVMTSGGGSVNGSLLRESGLNIGFGLEAPRWLRAVRLPINAHVERELCAEFQLLEALCEVLASASAVAGASLDAARREQTIGSVEMLITGSSCASCLCALRQFRLLWPNVTLAVGMLRARAALPELRIGAGQADRS